MIRYDTMRGTMLGDLLIAASDDGLCAVMFGNRSEQRNLSALVSLFPAERIEKSPDVLASYRREIEEYLAGRRKHFTQPIDLGAVRAPFQRKVLGMLTQVPFGELVSYGDLAARAGSPGAARAVGAAMAANPVPVVVPCHRVVESSGGLGGYTGGLSYKRKLLAHEGVEVAEQGVLF